MDRIFHNLIDDYCPSHNHKNRIKVISPDQSIKRISIGLGVKNNFHLKNNEKYYANLYNNESKF